MYFNLCELFMIQHTYIHMYIYENDIPEQRGLNLDAPSTPVQVTLHGDHCLLFN